MISAFLLVLIIFLVSLDIVIVSRERSSLYFEADQQSQNELSLIGTFVTEPMLRHEFATVEQFMLQWGDKNPNVVRIRALSPAGLLFAEYQSHPQRADEFLTAKRSIYFADQHLLDLELTKDLSPLTTRLADFRQALFIRSLIATMVIGTILWFIFKLLALRPLEQEIIKRTQAEDDLQKAHNHLEARVETRTAELSRALKNLNMEMHERNLAEQALAAEKERLSITLRSIGDGVITTDTDYKVLTINKVAERLTGWNQEAATGKPVDTVCQIIDQQNNSPCDNPVKKAIATGMIIDTEKDTILIANDGSQKKIAQSAAPICNEKSRIIGAVLVFRDVTEKSKLEEELLKAKKIESIGVLAGGIAHDFNNILTAIMGNISLATRLADRNNQIYDLLTAAGKAGVRAKDLIQQLLTFSKGGDPVKKIASITEIISDSADFILHGSNARCEYHFQDDLWPLEIDKGQISQVIQNIILNANQAMPKGGNIKISCENYHHTQGDALPLLHDKYVRIKISDQGVGIPKELLDKIFDPYFTTKEKGDGLGLAITHSIVNKHGGHIMVDSQPGQGTTFTIYLAASGEKIKAAPLVVNLPQSKGQEKILVMDDEAIVRDVAHDILDFLGYQVEFANDGQEALELYRGSLEKGTPFDIVIMDLTIPGGMGGKETMEKLLKIDPQVKAIVTSGYSNDPIMANYKDYGFKGVLNKPFQVKDLGDEIHQILNRP
ncbi:MAG: ATP-binding protein [Desulfobulbaceae bacterium]|nr:ATP-binding protein [Desulfobulbaceae bacterium]HIJ77879.1 response regulator [Deltaproteobacteria bacterium]